MPQGRKRVVLSPYEKKEIINIKDNHPEFKIADIAEEYYKRTKKTVSNSTISTILSNRDAIMSNQPYGKKSSKVFSISTEVMYKVEEARANEKMVTEAFVIEKAWEQVRKHKLDESLYVFSTSWASNILKGVKDDVSIIKQKDKKPSSTKGNPPISSDVSLFLDLSTLERNSLIEEKNTPYECSTTSEDVTTPVASKSTFVAIAPADSQNTAQTAKSGSKKRPSMTPMDDSNVSQSTQKRRHSTTSSPSKKVVKEEIADTTLVKLQNYLSSIGDKRDYRSVLFSLLEKTYKDNPYFVPIMSKELDNVMKTLKFMVEKEGKTWCCVF